MTLEIRFRFCEGLSTGDRWHSIRNDFTFELEPPD